LFKQRGPNSLKRPTSELPGGHLHPVSYATAYGESNLSFSNLLVY